MRGYPRTIEDPADQPVLKEPTIEGAKLVRGLSFGCLAFAIFMALGTFLLAKLLSPYFAKVQAKQQAAQQANEATQERRTR